MICSRKRSSMGSGSMLRAWSMVRTAASRSAPVGVEVCQLLEGVDGHAAHVLLLLDQPVVRGAGEGLPADAVSVPCQQGKTVLRRGRLPGGGAPCSQKAVVGADDVGVETNHAPRGREGVEAVILGGWVVVIDRPLGIDKEDAQPEAMPGELWESADQTAEASIVRKSERVLRIREGHPLHQLTEGSEEVVGLLRLAGRFTLALHDETLLAPRGF
jgi:hypothetical protein